MILAAVLFAAGTFSCSNSSDKPTNPAPLESGSLELTMRFDNSQFKATQSTAKPTTTWQNINNLMILFVNSSDVVVAAELIAAPNSNDASDQSMVIDAIPVGDYTTYLVANHNDATIARAGSSQWNQANVVGMNINALTLSLTQHDQYTPTAEESGSTGYHSPSELFIAKMPTTITADQTTAQVEFNLARMVSLMRVRINQANNGNNAVDFTTDDAELRIRRATTTATLNSGVATSTSEQNLIYGGGESLFSSSEPANGYSSGSILDIANGYTLWSDMIIFPGGSDTDGEMKFNIVLSALAPVGYVPFGTTTALTEATTVYWSGQVESAVASNNILEVNCTLLKAGSTSIQEAVKFGNLDMLISIADWGNISSTNIEM